MTDLQNKCHWKNTRMQFSYGRNIVTIKKSFPALVITYSKCPAAANSSLSLISLSQNYIIPKDIFIQTNKKKALKEASKLGTLIFNFGINLHGRSNLTLCMGNRKLYASTPHWKHLFSNSSRHLTSLNATTTSWMSISLPPLHAPSHSQLLPLLDPVSAISFSRVNHPPRQASLSLSLQSNLVVHLSDSSAPHKHAFYLWTRGGGQESVKFQEQ